jgi:glucose-6-phosphate 1-epimerase
MTELTRRAGDLPRGGTWSVYDQGAQLATWTPGPDPVLLLSSRTATEPGRPVPGGVPVCFPWFGPGRGEPREPAHGFARVAPWRLGQLEQDEHGARLVYELDQRDVRGLPGAELFPVPFRATCSIEVGATARVTLTVRNTGTDPFDYEAALHSYLYVGDVARVRLRGLDGCTWWDKLEERTYRQESDLALQGETDRVYHHQGAVEVDDPVLDRVLVVDKEGSADTVVWTPGPEKAAGIPDLGPGEWEHLLCVEAGNVLDHAVSLRPGEEHALRTTITTRSR